LITIYNVDLVAKLHVFQKSSKLFEEFNFMAKKESSSHIKYKYRALKTYASNEWLADSKKKYRQVFDQNESKTIYAEFSFFNKLFDQEDWEAEITLKVYRSSGAREKGSAPSAADQQIFDDIHLPVFVSKDQHEVYVREGFGDEKLGNTWTEGTYYWEAYIDGEYVASKKFYIYDVGPVSGSQNPYMEIKSLQLYEGPKKNVRRERRVYLSEFKDNDTRFIWLEFVAKNKVKIPWVAEITFNFYNSTRQLKGQTVELIHIKRQQKYIETTWGWGSDYRGTWFEDKYTVEVVFMDKLIAVLPFKVGKSFTEGTPNLLTPNEHDLITGIPNYPEVEDLTLDEVLKEMDELIGLYDIKQRIKEYAQYLRFLYLRIEKGLDDKIDIPLHAVFTGNPGTGKTTVARMLGKIYKKLGLLSKGHVYEVDRADIVGEYIGQTAPKVRTVLEKARGGILFVDEAYALARGEEDVKDYGREVIEMLVKEMSNGKGDWALVVAGYPKEMDIFLRSNPGLKSRFNLKFEFPDYLPEELHEIALQGAAKQGVSFTPEADKLLAKKLVEAFRNRDRNFGHARYALSLIGEAKLQLGLRIMQTSHPEQMTSDMLSTITRSDLEAVFEARKSPKVRIPIDESLLNEAMAELNGLIGLHQVKKSIEELVSLVKYYAEIGKDVLNAFFLHAVFTGNPGTGKTTVARIIGKTYKALGILERGDVIECDRQMMVAGYSGQTAEKTHHLIESARGSVLFIDEAYTLIQGPNDFFGREAVETLLKRMEDLRGEIIVIVAGYPDNMWKFLESNPGLKSRFDRKMEFEDYQPTELLQIAMDMLQREQLFPTPSAKEHLYKYLSYLVQHKNKYFGNARAVRKIIEKTIHNQHLRLSTMKAEKRTEKVLRNLTIEDVREFQPGNDILLEDNKQKRIGF